MTSEQDIKNALQTTVDKFGRLDVAVNCAGIATASRIYNFKKNQPFDLKMFQKTIEVSVTTLLSTSGHPIWFNIFS